MSVGVSRSGMKGGIPAVEKKVDGVGKVSPKANCVSRLASTPAREPFCGFWPPNVL